MKIFKKVIQYLSVDEIDVEEARHFANLKRLDPMRIFYNVKNFHVVNQGFKVPIRLYFPDRINKKKNTGMILYFHGGGWTTDSIDTYDRICSMLAKSTHHMVLSVDYRLAPENKFPIGLMDCYKVCKVVYNIVDPQCITLMGDSAGANLAAAISLMCKDKKEFMPKRQILIYPVVNSDFSSHSPFPSVVENGQDYILTMGKLQDYIELYASKPEDLTNPYFAPIYAKDLTNQPDTLILTSQFDPLKDEGQAYGKRLQEAGNDVVMHEIERAMHGFFALGIKNFHVQETFDWINAFLKEREGIECHKKENIGEN